MKYRLYTEGGIVTIVELTPAQLLKTKENPIIKRIERL